MNLQNFFPNRLAVLAEAVSRSVAQVYTERFDLTRDEWRVLAALAECGAMKTVDLIAHTTLDKMPVSRAVTRLEGSGLVAREQDPDDRRNHVLRLQPPGQALVRKIAPMVKAREDFLLAALEPPQRVLLDAALVRMLARARQLIERG